MPPSLFRPVCVCVCKCLLFIFNHCLDLLIYNLYIERILFQQPKYKNKMLVTWTTTEASSCRKGIQNDNNSININIDIKIESIDWLQIIFMFELFGLGKLLDPITNHRTSCRLISAALLLFPYWSILNFLYWIPGWNIK